MFYEIMTETILRDKKRINLEWKESQEENKKEDKNDNSINYKRPKSHKSEQEPTKKGLDINAKPFKPSWERKSIQSISTNITLETT